MGWWLEPPFCYCVELRNQNIQGSSLLSDKSDSYNCHSHLPLFLGLVGLRFRSLEGEVVCAWFVEDSRKFQLLVTYYYIFCSTFSRAHRVTLQVPQIADGWRVFFKEKFWCANLHTRASSLALTHRKPPFLSFTFLPHTQQTTALASSCVLADSFLENFDSEDISLKIVMIVYNQLGLV